MKWVNPKIPVIPTQITFTCLKSTIETLERVSNMLKMNNKSTKNDVNDLNNRRGIQKKMTSVSLIDKNCKS